ncbi:MAG: TIM barrel protein [Verrucomicrobiota bacterium]
MIKITPGLVSITFRDLEVKEVIDLTKRAGLKAIEWGGDVHVPHGDLKRAKEVGQMTREAGLQVAAYGSYYRVGVSEHDGLSFESVLESAQALGASSIRVWPGNKGSEESDSPYRDWVTEELKRISEMATPARIRVALEYHAGTLTDTNASARQLLDDVNDRNCLTLWQPPNGKEFEYCLEGLRMMLPELLNIHVFHWWPDIKNRFPLEEGRDRWIPYFKQAVECNRSFYALLEFVKDDDPEQLVRDAATLKRWIDEVLSE